MESLQPRFLSELIAPRVVSGIIILASNRVSLASLGVHGFYFDIKAEDNRSVRVIRYSLALGRAR